MMDRDTLISDAFKRERAEKIRKAALDLLAQDFFVTLWREQSLERQESLLKEAAIVVDSQERESFLVDEE